METRGIRAHSKAGPSLPAPATEHTVACGESRSFFRFPDRWLDYRGGLPPDAGQPAPDFGALCPRLRGSAPRNCGHACFTIDSRWQTCQILTIARSLSLQ